NDSRRLAVRDVADEGLTHTVRPAIDPMVEPELLRVLFLSRVLEAEPAARVPLAARKRRAGGEEAGDEVGAGALGGACAARVERPSGHRPLEVAVHLPDHPGKQRRAMLALADDGRTWVGARARSCERPEPALVLAANGV